MTSQKRYRHHQDGNISSARVRDIPPRFKRQKSSSSPIRASTPTLHETHTSNTDTKITDPLEAVAKQSNSLSGSATVITRDTQLYQFENQLAGQIKPVADIQQTGHPVISSPTIWQSPQKSKSAFSQSTWDSSYQASLDFHGSPVSLGTHFGYKTNGSTSSQWTCKSATKQCAVNSPSRTPTVNNVIPDQGIHYTPGYLSNSEIDAYYHFKNQDSSEINWNITTPLYEHYPATSSPAVRISKSPISSDHGDKVKSNKDLETNCERRIIGYSDNDARTIEMLRELERVADQKETENDEFGADKKSLVSYHLRMLICAVDKYTEGIVEELAMAPRHDEVIPLSDSRGSSPRASPALCKTYLNEQTKEAACIQIKLHMSLWSPTLSRETSSPDRKNNAVSNQNQVPLLPSSVHTSPFMNKKKESVGQEVVPWDLWSSPSFNFCDVLTNQTQRE